MQKSMMLAIVSVGFIASGCVTQKALRGIVQQEVGPVRADVNVINFRLDTLTTGVNGNFVTVQEDMAKMRDQIAGVNNLAADAGKKAGAAVLKISSVYDEMKKVKASVGAARTEAKKTQAEAAKAHAELAAKITTEAETVRKHTTAEETTTRSAITADGTATRSAASADGVATRTLTSSEAANTRTAVATEAANVQTHISSEVSTATTAARGDITAQVTAVDTHVGRTAAAAKVAADDLIKVVCEIGSRGAPKPAGCP